MDKNTTKELFFPALKEAAIKVAVKRNASVSIDDPEVITLFTKEMEEYETWLEAQYAPVDPTPPEIFLNRSTWPGYVI